MRSVVPNEAAQKSDLVIPTPQSRLNNTRGHPLLVCARFIPCVRCIPCWHGLIHSLPRLTSAHSILFPPFVCRAGARGCLFVLCVLFGFREICFLHPLFRLLFRSEIDQPSCCSCPAQVDSYGASSLFITYYLLRLFHFSSPVAKFKGGVPLAPR